MIIFVVVLVYGIGKQNLRSIFRIQIKPINLKRFFFRIFVEHAVYFHNGKKQQVLCPRKQRYAIL